MRRMREIYCPGNFRIEPWDSRFYALFQGEELICVTAYKIGAVRVMNLLHGLSGAAQEMDRLVSDLWWFIENVDEDDPERSEKFFALRERVRADNARTEVKPHIEVYEEKAKEAKKMNLGSKASA